MIRVTAWEQGFPEVKKPARQAGVRRNFHADDGGFSTVGMVLALLVSVSLVLSAAQVYRIRSLAADVQNVADACALAAQKQVATFYVVAQVCDCAVFSLSAAGTATLGLGLVAACIPPVEALSAKLVRAGRSLLEARTRFGRACAEGLDRLQALLPLFAAVNAAALAAANAGQGASYHAIALLVPLHAEPTEASGIEGDREVLDEMEGQREQLALAASEADDALRACEEHKHAAFMADCGAAPGYCMYERAAVLAGMGGRDNPHYGSEDAWSFGVALKRARAYYAARFQAEAPLSDSVEEQARSAIRSRLYAYAQDALAQGYVIEEGDSFSASFPLLPRNTAEMRSTRLYTEEVWPVFADEEGSLVTHAYDSCPAAEGQGYLGLGSVAQMEEEGMPCCALCGFAASSVGKVAAASSNIDNGFEYHYRIVAQQAALYQHARKLAQERERAAKGPAERLFEALESLMSEARDARIRVQPPGRTGAIALVFDAGGFSVADLLPNSLVVTAPAFGTRMAISAATLADDDASETETVVSSLLDGLLDGVAGAAFVDAAFDLWSGLLVAYTQTSASLAEGIEHALDSLPLVGRLGLGSWAAGKLVEAVDAAGLSPPDLVSHKPVVVNSYHVASADGASFCQGLVQAKQALASSFGPVASDPVSALVGVAGGQLLASYESWDATFVIARIELAGEGGASIPLEITLPPALKEKGAGLIEEALEALLSAAGRSVEVRRWN